MLRTIALLSLTTTFIACSGNNNGNNGNGNNNNNGGGAGTGGGADMATGTGGNGGGGGSDGGSGNSDGGMLPDLAGLPAPDHDPKQHPPLPTMGQYYNTMSTFTAPVVYPVVWTGEAQTNGKDTGMAVQAFLTDMMQSDYWYNGVKEYGGGKGTVKPVITLGAVPSTITDQQLQQTISSNLGKPGWPASGDKQAIVVFLTDPTTTVTNGSASSCKDFGGYHSSAGGGLGGGGTTYAVADYCYKQGTTTPDWEQFTFAISHEIAESVTDFNLNVNRVVDGSGFPFLGGGEDGDMCLDLPSTQKWASGTYNVSRLWSNAVAMANTADPCIPNDQGPWFGAAFDSGDASKPGELAIPLTNGAGQATFKILPFEYDPSVGPIAFYILGAVIPQGVTFDPDIAVKTDPTTGGVLSGHVMYANAGSTVTVTVKVDSTYVKPGPFQPSTVQLLIVARTEDKSRYNLWWADLAPQ